MTNKGFLFLFQVKSVEEGRADTKGEAAGKRITSRRGLRSTARRQLATDRSMGRIRRGTDADTFLTGDTG